MNNVNLQKCPEDVFFSKCMIDFNIGKVADYNTAKQFSVESIDNDCSFGGHCFWISNPNWKNRLNNTIIQFKEKINNIHIEHRSGWNTIKEYFKNNNLYNNKSGLVFFDLLEAEFLWKTDYYCADKWCGIIHCTQQTPTHLDPLNVCNLFKNKNFIKSLDNCFLLITLSNYLKKYILTELTKINKSIKVEVLKHPVDKNCKLFNLNQYNLNNSKKIIQIGQQLRRLSSIYLLKLPSTFSKLILTGTKNMKRFKGLLNYENLNIDLDQIKIYYTSSVEEYDDLLSINIVFIHLYDSSANNAILECIIRNTPVIVNKIEAVVEYLGPNYPLYFENIDEVPELLNKIPDAYNYLVNMDKSDLGINYFYKKLLTAINYAYNDVK
jgi:hypothetical protein